MFARFLVLIYALLALKNNAKQTVFTQDAQNYVEMFAHCV
jgi:hypothetical protein